MHRRAYDVPKAAESGTQDEISGRRVIRAIALAMGIGMPCSRGGEAAA